ncbi:lysophosphatidic acid phosphatase type 6-like isoform X1 [Actinia tenebrosa]|uniref:Lysophosphatidic acid phosphatase type 6-like isoform X1 n=1 Tax=Actinia tenebrosa TaxID=6105 RepID=A0A6P8H5I1_ACTTE|nr:lysophosphatidic acid phosphatase type 6-like isoform X1 [Actinia tenebrosa]
MAARLKFLGRVCGIGLGAFLSVKTAQKATKYHHNVIFAREEDKEYQLVHVQVAFRHGARTPIFSLPEMQNASVGDVVWDKDKMLGDLPETLIKYRVKDLDGGRQPVSEYDTRQKKVIWPGGSEAGQLTKLGQRQMYDLGKNLHRRYIKEVELLHPQLVPQEIYVRTSNMQRTIDSARCVIAGLYGQQNVKGVVTMVTCPEKDESIYPNSHYCMAIKKWAHSALSTAFLMSNIDGYKKDYEEFKEAAGIKDKHVFVFFRDFIAAQEAHGMPVSPIFIKYREMIERNATHELVSVQCGYPHGRHEILRLGVGQALENILERMKDKITKKSPSYHRLCLYSVHDTTIICMLVCLGLYNNEWPDFSADLAFELYKKKDGQYFVKILLQGKEQILPGATSAMYPFEKFRKLITSYSVEDWHQECNQQHH